MKGIKLDIIVKRICIINNVTSHLNNNINKWNLTPDNIKR